MVEPVEMAGTLLSSVKHQTVSRSGRGWWLAMLVLAVFSLMCYLLTYLFRQWYAQVWLVTGLYILLSGFYLLACWVALTKPLPVARTLVLITSAGLLFRVALAPQVPWLSDDVYRYVWDGRVQAAGISPYTYTPADPALQVLRDPHLWPLINRPNAHTIYPPAAQATFRLLYALTPHSVAWTKFWLSLLDVGATGLLVTTLATLNRSPLWAIIYAWHPLVVFEIGHSGHIEAAMLLFLSAALLARSRHWSGITGLLLGLATLVKFYPALLLPALWRRGDWRFPLAFALTIVVGYLPFLISAHNHAREVLGFLPEYLKEEGFGNGTRYFLLNLLHLTLPLPVRSWMMFVTLAIAGLGLHVAFRRETRPDTYLAGALALLLAYLLFLTPTYPWYGLWLVLLLCFRPHPLILAFTLSLFFSYTAWWLGADQRAWFYLNAARYLPVCALVCSWVVKPKETA